MQNDTSLLSNKLRLRQAVNNYYQAAMRNLLYEGVVFDSADDPGSSVHASLNEAIGGFLDQTNELFQNGDAAGGVPVEGAFFYGQESISFTSMALLGLYTAGLGDPATNGPQVALATSERMGTRCAVLSQCDRARGAHPAQHPVHGARLLGRGDGADAGSI